MVSQTDRYSIHSTDPARPGSPAAVRSHLRTQSNIARARSAHNVAIKQLPVSPKPKGHRPSHSYVPSIYTLKTNNSETSLVLANQPAKSAFENRNAIMSLSRDGYVEGLFPRHHLVRNITHFMRFASASYGSHFLRIMGIKSLQGRLGAPPDDTHHQEHHAFSHHTQLPAHTILLSSFVDPQGGTDSSGRTSTGVPMVHYVSLDHDSRAVVLTCRGTLGFEDVLADMTCDYDDIIYQGKSYKVHKGIHASARRLLEGSVLATIKAGLEEFPEYGIVLCGHSLGGAVAALLAILLAEPNPDMTTSTQSSQSTAFIAATHHTRNPLLLTSDFSQQNTTPHSPQLTLPSNRPIHAYAYGPPSTLSPALRAATRSLITTIIHNQDLVPYLSLGVLHDLQAVALAFKTDTTGAKSAVAARVWEGLRGHWGSASASGSKTFAGAHGDAESDVWAFAALKALRANMQSEKLVPPGEVFVVDAQAVLQRDAFTAEVSSSGGESGLGRPATRARLRYVRDVQGRFGEVRFGGSMLLDHSPGRYEVALGALGRGVLG